MAKSRKPRKKTSAQIKRDIAKVIAATRTPAESAEPRLSVATLALRSAIARRQQLSKMSPGERYRAVVADKQAKLDRDLPWRHSYANWCTHLGAAAAKYNARIAYGSETYDAWESGISPDAYARMHAKR